MPEDDDCAADSGKDYLSFLLRLWRSEPGKTAEWRTSLQDIQSGQRLGFACLDDLVVYLKERMGQAIGGSSDCTDSDGCSSKVQ
ncbi:MAG: hypothetical protein ACYC6L_04625 [Anaerolineae bacterium]